MTEPQRIDFSRIIAEIEAAGVTQYKIAMMMHRQITQVKRWKAGSEPRHYEGQMLLQIHGEYVKRETLQVSPVDHEVIESMA